VGGGGFNLPVTGNLGIFAEHLLKGFHLSEKEDPWTLHGLNADFTKSAVMAELL
jgi:hypothetical protein